MKKTEEIMIRPTLRKLEEISELERR